MQYGQKKVSLGSRANIFKNRCGWAGIIFSLYFIEKESGIFIFILTLGFSYSNPEKRCFKAYKYYLAMNASELLSQTK